MPRSVHVALVLAALTLVVGGPWWYKREHDRHFRSFHVVHEGVLYRSGQLDRAGLQRLLRDYGIRTVVCLREGDAAEDAAEEQWVRGGGLGYVRIPPRSWWRGADGKAPADEGVAAFRRVMQDPANYPVLVHCFAGIHRTGAHCAIYRMDFEGWSNREAIAEMRSLGYTTLDGDLDVLDYLEHYHSPLGRQIDTAAP